MNKYQRSFQKNNITIDSVIQLLKTPEREKPQIIFPFTEKPKRNHDEIVAKILIVNFRESTQIKNKDIDVLSQHIFDVLNDADFETIQNGEMNENYFKIIDKISHSHGIKSKSANKNEDNLISFATKFCGNHNQKAPFLDNLVYELLIFLHYPLKYRNYQEYVEIFKKIQQEYDLSNYSLREIEYAMWEKAKSAK